MVKWVTFCLIVGLCGCELCLPQRVNGGCYSVPSAGVCSTMQHSIKRVRVRLVFVSGRVWIGMIACFVTGLFQRLCGVHLVSVVRHYLDVSPKECVGGIVTIRDWEYRIRCNCDVSVMSSENLE